MRPLALLSGVVLSAMSCHAQRPNLIANGGFELSQIGLALTSTHSWNVAWGNIDIVPSTFANVLGFVPEGNLACELAGTPGYAAIHQSISVQEGRQYLLSGFVGVHVGTPFASAHLYLDGLYINTYGVTLQNANTGTWSPFQYRYEAKSDAMDVMFSDSEVSGDPWRGSGLDDLKLEPSTYAVISAPTVSGKRYGEEIAVVQGNVVALDGSKSVDGDENPIPSGGYFWEVVAPNGSLTTSFDSSIAIQASKVGQYYVHLRVTDVNGDIDEEQATFEVVPAVQVVAKRVLRPKRTGNLYSCEILSEAKPVFGEGDVFDKIVVEVDGAENSRRDGTFPTGSEQSLMIDTEEFLSQVAGSRIFRVSLVYLKRDAAYNVIRRVRKDIRLNLKAHSKTEVLDSGFIAASKALSLPWVHIGDGTNEATVKLEYQRVFWSGLASRDQGFARVNSTSLESVSLLPTVIGAFECNTYARYYEGSILTVMPLTKREANFALLKTQHEKTFTRPLVVRSGTFAISLNGDTSFGSWRKKLGTGLDDIPNINQILSKYASQGLLTIYTTFLQLLVLLEGYVSGGWEAKHTFVLNDN